MTNNLQSDHAARSHEMPGVLNRQFVVFLIGSQKYCIDILSVREIRVVQTITTLPGAAEHIRGIINLRGTIVPVMDLRRRFSLGETVIAENQALVIVSVDGQPAALLVDEVLDILSTAVDLINAVPTRDGTRRSPYFEGVISNDETMLIVVDINHITQSGTNSDEEWSRASGATAVNV